MTIINVLQTNINIYPTFQKDLHSRVYKVTVWVNCRTDCKKHLEKCRSGHLWRHGVVSGAN